jgi:plastocyanin
MGDHSATRSVQPRAVLAALAALVLLLAACSSSGSPSEEPFSQAPSSAAPASEPPASQPAASEAAPSEAGTARCELTPDASPSATITISGNNFGDEITVTAGQAVAFTNGDALGHTVTEGTGGQAAADGCVDTPVGPGGTVIVTFNEAGDYPITCKIHATMQTVIHVQ